MAMNLTDEFIDVIFLHLKIFLDINDASLGFKPGESRATHCPHVLGHLFVIDFARRHDGKHEILLEEISVKISGEDFDYFQISNKSMATRNIVNRDPAAIAAIMVFCA